MELPKKLDDKVANQEDIISIMDGGVEVYESFNNKKQSNVREIIFRGLELIGHAVGDSDVVVGNIEFPCEDGRCFCFDGGKQLTGYFQPVKEKDSKDDKKYYVNINPFQWTQIYNKAREFRSDE